MGGSKLRLGICWLSAASIALYDMSSPISPSLFSFRNQPLDVSRPEAHRPTQIAGIVPDAIRRRIVRSETLSAAAVSLTV
jgi:hypothetical protein